MERHRRPHLAPSHHRYHWRFAPTPNQPPLALPPHHPQRRYPERDRVRVQSEESRTGEAEGGYGTAVASACLAGTSHAAGGER